MVCTKLCWRPMWLWLCLKITRLGFQYKWSYCLLRSGTGPRLLKLCLTSTNPSLIFASSCLFLSKNQEYDLNLSLVPLVFFHILTSCSISTFEFTHSFTPDSLYPFVLTHCHEAFLSPIHWAVTVSSSQLKWTRVWDFGALYATIMKTSNLKETHSTARYTEDLTACGGTFITLNIVFFPLLHLYMTKGENERLVPEELSYCRSGGGPLRHSPIKNWLFLSWRRVSIFFFNFQI